MGKKFVSKDKIREYMEKETNLRLQWAKEEKDIADRMYKLDPYEYSEEIKDRKKDAERFESAAETLKLAMYDILEL